jgi:hypothetical protein
MKLLIMQFPPIPRHFIPPRSKYSPQHPVSSRGQPKKDGPPAWYLGVGLTTPHRKK